MSSKTAGRFCVLELTLATARRVSGTERGLVSSCSASGLSFLPDRRMVCAWVAALRMALKLLAFNHLLALDLQLLHNLWRRQWRVGAHEEAHGALGAELAALQLDLVPEVGLAAQGAQALADAACESELAESVQARPAAAKHLAIAVQK